MGQYYKPILLAEDRTTPKAWAECYDYGSLAKLLEHSWIKNRFVGAIEKLLKKEPQHIVWAGDYADGEPTGPLKENWKNLQAENQHLNLYAIVREDKSIKIKPPAGTVAAKYLVNHTRKEYVNKSKGIDKNGWKLHPLPLLTSEGCGRGGGDYREDSELVGLWARDLIGVQTTPPEGYTEIIFDLHD